MSKKIRTLAEAEAEGQGQGVGEAQDAPKDRVLLSGVMALSPHHYITNLATFGRTCKTLTGQSSPEAIVKLVKAAVDAHREFYVTKTRRHSLSQGDYCLIPTGVPDKKYGCELYVSLGRQNGTMDYKGYSLVSLPYFCRYLQSSEVSTDACERVASDIEKLAVKIGAPEREVYLIAHLDEAAEAMDPESETSPGQQRVVVAKKDEALAAFDAIVKEIEKRLLANPFRSSDGIALYLHQLSRKATDSYNAKSPMGMMRNSTSGVAVNTGLMDSFGRDIVVLMEKTKGKADLTVVGIADSQSALTEAGFAGDRSALEGSLLLVDPEERFAPEERGVDVSFRALEHMLLDNAERIPDAARAMSLPALAAAVERSVDVAVRMQRRGCDYVKPYYSVRYGTVSWVAPLLTTGRAFDEPELLMVIADCSGSYKVKTILPYSDFTADKVAGSRLYRTVW